MLKPLVTVTALALLLAGLVHAQTPSTKKDLVAKIMQLQQPGLEGLARQLVEQPALLMMQQVGGALQRMPAERREALAADIQADARKYVDEAFPLVRDKALKVAPLVIAPALEERFSEDELKQIIATLESPVLKRFQGTMAELQRPLTEKMVADSRSQIEPKVLALQEATAKRLGVSPPNSAASAARAAPGGGASGAKKR